MKVALYWAFSSLAALVMATGVSAYAQEMAGMPTPLAPLISEAQSSNTQLSAADHAWKAATHVAQQVTTLPDPQFTVQSFSVGSPRPFAGFSNSDFAYIGFGASQELPYAGKLRLKGEIADRDADMQRIQADLLRSSITDQVKILYLRLAYLDATLSIPGKNDAVLKPLIETGLSRYSLGQGSQADVLKAQIEHTKILREVTMHHQEMGQLQAGLKELLHRSQSSPDIIPEPLSLTPLQQLTADELQNLVLAHNPAVSVDTAGVRISRTRNSGQRKHEGKPDFNVGYMFQQTGGGYRDYYMLAIRVCGCRDASASKRVLLQKPRHHGAIQTGTRLASATAARRGTEAIRRRDEHCRTFDGISGRSFAASGSCISRGADELSIRRSWQAGIRSGAFLSARYSDL